MSVAEMQAEILRLLCAEVEKGNAILERIRVLHKPFGIYGECDCADKTDAGHVYFTHVGLTCALLYRVCAECCTYGDGIANYQTEECAGTHTHAKGGPLCATSDILSVIYADVFTRVQVKP